MELRHIIHRRISKFLSLSDKLCTATYVGFEMNQQSFGSSMRYIATRIFVGFVGELGESGNQKRRLDLQICRFGARARELVLPPPFTPAAPS